MIFFRASGWSSSGGLLDEGDEVGEGSAAGCEVDPVVEGSTPAFIALFAAPVVCWLFCCASPRCRVAEVCCVLSFVGQSFFK